MQLHVWSVSERNMITSVTPILRELHLLPDEKRKTYKVFLITFKCLNNLAPFYLSDLITQYKPTRTLRSAFMNLLVIPRTNTIRYMAKEHFVRQHLDSGMAYH